MHFRFELVPTKGMTWPSVYVTGMNNEHGPFTIENALQHVEIDLEVDKSVCIKYVKNQSETVMQDNAIVADQALQLRRCWVDDVLMESWFLTESCYHPRYFSGFLDQYPDSASEIKSQLVWHFPGEFIIKFEMPFWDWYHQQRQHYHRFNNIDKDQERWENYTGSYQAHADLVNEIYEMLHVR